MQEIAPEGQRILVTGGAGFIGSHLVDALVENNDVRVLDNLSTGQRDNVHSEATLVEGDIRDGETLETALSDIDLVFHEAAQVSVQRSVEVPEKSFEINTRPTLQILERARTDDIRVILASSCAIYGDPDYVPIDEEHPPSPSSPYGLEKLTIDRYARLYNDLYGVETVALRYFNVYGPRQTAGDYSGVISIFVDQATEGDDITVEGDGEQTRDFVHVDDVVRANLLAARTDAVGEAFNIGTGSSVTIRELSDMIQEVAKSNSDIVHVDPRSGDIGESRAEIDKAQTKLGFDPRTTLREGLESLIDE
ncbi:UDP-glucose 4-epimerase [Natronoarchaeum philippinense]|uniref:UDP-glucose 4-epimerase n=1 Tax=Natronoarchaeum philippinense TaxID=558529 RepID=A0A285P0W2_NATPI|nr:NAD-dependent epimerase/dehydratase family protein [Natronoarchaeum philippinense]SNZ15365.1 UDP-glucose 4-epimerase [Natronoarchaeum philippinense]